MHLIIQRSLATWHSPKVRAYRGASLMRNSPPPSDHHGTLDSPTVGVPGGGGVL